MILVRRGALPCSPNRKAKCKRRAVHPLNLPYPAENKVFGVGHVQSYLPITACMGVEIEDPCERYDGIEPIVLAN